MSRRHYQLPPLTSLSAFETAARHLSFKDAAQELSVTPGAVSHQVKALEEELGVALFQRRHRGVELTRHGQVLFETLSTAFQQVSTRLTKIRDGESSDSIAVGSTTAVAALWLSPAIIRFWRDHPEININQVTQDQAFRNRTDLDFFIRYGRDQDTALENTPLYRDELVAVAKPELAEQLQGCDLETLAKQRLIHLESSGQTWTTWTQWFQQLGYQGQVQTNARVTSYSVALQMAKKGAGIALGWRKLIRSNLEKSKLAVVSNHGLPAPEQFYLVGLPESELAPNARLLKNWIIETAKDPR